MGGGWGGVALWLISSYANKLQGIKGGGITPASWGMAELEAEAGSKSDDLNYPQNWQICNSLWEREMKPRSGRCLGALSLGRTMQNSMCWHSVGYGWRVRLGKLRTLAGLGRIWPVDVSPRLVLNIILLSVLAYGDPSLIPMKPNLGLFSSGFGCSALINVSCSLVNLQALEIIQSNEEN